MGADLYRSDIDELPAKQRIDMELKLMMAGGMKRTQTEDERQAWLRDYEEAHQHPYYFRDSYNGSNLLWKIDISWWQDLDEYYGPHGDGNDCKEVGEDGHEWTKPVLYPAGSKRLEQEIRNRAELLSYRIKDLPDDERIYFFEKYDLFLDFLKQAHEGGHTIRCSV